MTSITLIYITPNGLWGWLPQVSMCILPLTDILVGSEAMTASKWHQRSYDLRFDISNLYYPSIYVHVASNSHFGGVWGHGGLQMTSEVTSDLGNELSDLNYLCTHGFVASISSNSMKFTEKEAKYDPLTCMASPQVKTRGEPLMTCSDIFPILSSKLSQRSIPTSVLKSVTSITLTSMCILPF